MIGIDVGTSATKVVACDGAGCVVASASGSHPLSQSRPGWSEQDPRHWWTATIAALHEVLGRIDAADVLGVGLSGQMHGSVFLSADAIADGGDALRPALLWNDQRTASQCDEIERSVGGKRRLVELVGNAAFTGFQLPKVLWLREHEPRLFEQLAKVILPKDFIAWRLTGRLVTDVGDGSGTLVMDVDRRRWSHEVLGAVGLSADLYPPVVESGCVVGRITGVAAGRTGLAEGTPVVIGSGDNMTGGVGAGVVEPGMVLATLGTSGVIYAHADRPRRDLPETGPVGRLHTMCSATGREGEAGRWCVTGCMLSAAGSLQWCRETLFPNVTYEELLAEAAEVPPGSGGLVFLPYLTGERCPHPDPSARGGWIGLTSRHTRGHLVRAIIEGVSFGMGQILDLVRGIGVPVETVRVGGGGARSALWRQMLADVFGLPVVVTNAEEGPAYGAALLAGVGVGVWRDVTEACGQAIGVVETREPDVERGVQYESARAVYDELYDNIKVQFAALASVDD